LRITSLQVSLPPHYGPITWFAMSNAVEYTRFGKVYATGS
jgi:hypothetical protein